MRYLNGMKTNGDFDFANESIYEVIRREDGIFLFLNDHMERIKRNLEKVHQEALFDEILSQIKNYESEQSPESVMIVISPENIYITDIPVLELSDEERREGIEVGLFNYERLHPEVKLFRKTFKKQVSEYLKAEDLFEVLLTSHGEITEGSRSNFYYIMNGKIYEPESKKALPGIVKKNFLKVLDDNGIKVQERNIKVDEISKIEGALISGTGMDVTVIKSIYHHEMTESGLILSREMQQLYLDLKNQYKCEQKKQFF